MTSILIVDDHEILRHGLRDLLSSRLDGEVKLGEAGNARDAIRLLMPDTWDLVLLDINMPKGSGLEVLEEITRLRLRTRALVLTTYPEEQFALRAFKMGAAGYLTKQSVADELIRAVQRILAGGKYVTVSLAERLASSLGAPDQATPHEALSHRELQVFRLIAVGKTTKEIADELALSEKTVATYRTRIADKAGLKTSVEIARYAIKNGLVD
jgi:DNA-binding NarL/FixJ family response regulator